MRNDQPFHDGELLVQRRANEAEIAQRNGGVIANTIIKGALPFIGQQAMAVLGSLDVQGNVWASILVGDPGFVSAVNNRSVELDVAQPRSTRQDPLWANIQSNPEVGMLIIELASRRRLRINGRIERLDQSRYRIDVSQAYPNCPKYIQRRTIARLDPAADDMPLEMRSGLRLGSEQSELIACADTLFVASANPGHGVDVSHRGGQPGFVRIIDDRRLRIPDYAGNSMFNTLGNFSVYPHAGLAFIDFERSRILHLTGRAEILWAQDDPREEAAGTGRFWELEIAQWRELPLARQLNWELLDYSPHNPRPVKTADRRAAGLALEVQRIRSEAEGIKSFRLAAPDGDELPAALPGAHLPVTIRLKDGQLLQRHYSILSDSTQRRHYDIAVLLEPDSRGGSRHMHEAVHENDIIHVAAPRNDFPLSEKAEHHILIAGGIGITPILPMLRNLTESSASYEIHYAGRSKTHMAYRREVEALGGERMRLYFSEGLNTTRMNLDEILAVSTPNTHVYVCGPVRLINAVRHISSEAGWSAGQIHFESFGASAGNRQILITLARSGLTLAVPPSRSILDTLADAGITVPFDCKRGECGMCVTPVLEGEPEHRDVYLSMNEREHAMCLCVSRAQTENLTLDL